MNLNKFRTLDRAGRKAVLNDMHIERMRLEKIRTPDQMEPFLDELHRYEEEHEVAKNPSYVPQPRVRPSKPPPPTFWAVLLED